MKHDQLIQALDNCLPQTQCRLCGYPDCKSYATALADLKEKNLGLCVPGEQIALKKISAVLSSSSQSFQDQVNAQSRPATLAKIDAERCIGCMKCVPACPVDAIIGGAKKLHGILADECTGCELCIPSCPVDCINLEKNALNNPKNLYNKANLRRQRYHQQTLRRVNQKAQASKAHTHAKHGFSKSPQASQDARKLLIEAALKRAKKR